MALAAAAEHNIDLGKSVVIGDKAIDVGLARASGSLGILVRTGYGAKEEAKCNPDFVANDLWQAANWLSRRNMIAR